MFVVKRNSDGAVLHRCNPRPGGQSYADFTTEEDAACPDDTAYVMVLDHDGALDIQQFLLTELKTETTITPI